MYTNTLTTCLLALSTLTNAIPAGSFGKPGSFNPESFPQGINFPQGVAPASGSPAAAAPAKPSASAPTTSSSGSLEARGDCKDGFGPSSRTCWTEGFNVGVDTDHKWPDTGKTVTVDLEITKMTLSPDGTPREMQVFNGQYPGPTIYADWGDTIEVNVKNTLPDNGTSIHWHGLRQINSNQMDGTNGITECPLAPQATRKYVFKATQHGTSWYHSHYSVQYGDGLSGQIVIRGPHTANYDIDLGVVPLTDWYHEPMFELLASKPAAPPTSQTILVNGTSTNALSKIKFTPGKRHLLRFINLGINNNFHVGLDNHEFQIVSADFVPVKPISTKVLSLAVGQRYDVIVDASQDTRNYYLRVGTGGGKCDGPNEQFTKGLTTGAIVSYDGAGDAEPGNDNPTQLPQGCGEQENLVPFNEKTVPAPPSNPTALHLTVDTSAGAAIWKVNNEAMDIDWETPTLSYVQNGTYELPANDNGIVIKEAGWVYYIITNDTPLPHPIHLHGHDHYILATGTGDGSNAQLQLNNPLRRDTHQVAGNNGVPGQGGYVVMAFEADNPGAWLMHCHIPFHISGGLGIQFVERPEEIIDHLGNLAVYTDGCSSWDKFQSGPGNIPQPDSGLKRRRWAQL